MGRPIRGLSRVVRLTLMRTPFVKRQTPPRSGFLLFFPLSRAARSRQSVACPDLISVRRCTPMGCTKHLLRLYRLRRRLQGSPRTGLCDLEIILYPHTVLFKRVAEQASFAS